MDRMLVVVFDAKAKAIEGGNALLQLDDEGSISVYDHVVVGKNPDGSVKVQADDLGPLGTLAGVELGSLIGMVGGPSGLVMGAVVGLLSGSALDIHHARVNDEFIDDVTKELNPNRFAVVAEIQEGSTIPVDSRMKSLGGIVFRRTLSDVKNTLRQQHIAAMQANLAKIKAELASAHAERKAKLEEKINKLDSKIQEQLLKAYERREEAELADEAKAEALQAEAEKQESKAAEMHIQDPLHK